MAEKMCHKENPAKIQKVLANLLGCGRLCQPLLASIHFHAASRSIHRAFPESITKVGAWSVKKSGGKNSEERRIRARINTRKKQKVPFYFRKYMIFPWWKV
jgi:hypothetical protein